MAEKVSSIIFSTALNNKQLEKDLERTRRQIERLEKEIAVAESARLPYLEQSKQLAAQLDVAKAKLHEMQNAVIGSFPEEQIKEQAETVKSLQTQFDRVQKTVETYDKRIQKATVELDEAKETAGDIEKRLTTAGYSAEKMSDALKKADKNAEKFRLRMREVARSALVFSLISQALTEFKDWIVLVIKTNDEAISSIAQLKAALLTLAQPLVEILVPAFVKFVNILTIAATVAGRLLAAVFGKSYKDAQNAAQSLNKETEALDGVGSAAKKAAGSLAGFDEINTLATETAASTSLDFIAPDFSEVQELPKMLEEILSEIELKIKEIRFDWDQGEILKSKDAWIVALSGILGEVIGGAFFGLPGGVIGLLMGASIGLYILSFFDKQDSPGTLKNAFFGVIGAILGAVLGGMLAGFWGSAIGLGLGASIGLYIADVLDDEKDLSGVKDDFLTVMGELLGKVLGELFESFKGSKIGVLLGADVIFDNLEFSKKNKSKWDENDTIITVLSAILGAILGGWFGGIKGAGIGILFGATISFIAIKFSQGSYDKTAAQVSLRTAIMGILGIIAGAWFAGPVGAGVGFLLGMTIAFADAAFKGELHSLGSARRAFTVALTAILGAVIGAMGFGVFGGIVGGVIGLTLGVAITLTLEKIDDAAVRKKFASGQLGIGGGMFGGEVSLGRSIPALATGTVVPPNRQFMAILGDNKHETEVVSPLSTMKQALMEALQESGGIGGGAVTVVVNLDGKEVARSTVKHVNDMTRQAGKPVLLF